MRFLSSFTLWCEWIGKPKVDFQNSAWQCIRVRRKRFLLFISKTEADRSCLDLRRKYYFKKNAKIDVTFQILCRTKLIESFVSINHIWYEKIPIGFGNRIHPNSETMQILITTIQVYTETPFNWAKKKCRKLLFGTAFNRFVILDILPETDDGKMVKLVSLTRLRQNRRHFPIRKAKLHWNNFVFYGRLLPKHSVPNFY